ncbi:MAG: ankyrin repeat domain-containing protein [Acidobacteriota bacterium]
MIPPNAEVARILISSGIDLDVRSDEGRTALHDSIEHGRHEIQELLIQAGAEIDICAAAILGRIERVGELLAQDPELVNDRSTAGVSVATPCQHGAFAAS